MNASPCVEDLCQLWTTFDVNAVAKKNAFANAVETIGICELLEREPNNVCLTIST